MRLDGTFIGIEVGDAAAADAAIAAKLAEVCPVDIFTVEGFGEADAEVVMVIINDEQAEMDTELRASDRLEFLVSIQGG